MSDVLDDIIRDEIHYVHASKGSRFANYIIDRIAATVMVFALSVGYFAFIDIESAIEYSENDDDVIFAMWDYVLTTLGFVVYYTLFEFLTGGKTLGKYITRTRAVTEENLRLTLSEAFLRSICRIVPFEAFSFLGEQPTGWHDRWSKTKVIDDQDYQ